MNTPTKAKVVVTITIDPDAWEKAISDGWATKNLEKSILRQITLKDTEFHLATDVESVELLKYED